MVEESQGRFSLLKYSFMLSNGAWTHLNNSNISLTVSDRILRISTPSDTYVSVQLDPKCPVKVMVKGTTIGFRLVEAKGPEQPQKFQVKFQALEETNTFLSLVKSAGYEQLFLLRSVQLNEDSQIQNDFSQFIHNSFADASMPLSSQPERYVKRPRTSDTETILSAAKYVLSQHKLDPIAEKSDDQESEEHKTPPVIMVPATIEDANNSVRETPAMKENHDDLLDFCKNDPKMLQDLISSLLRDKSFLEEVKMVEEILFSKAK